MIYVFAYSDIFACQFRIGNIHGFGVYCTHVSVLTNRHQRLSKTNCVWFRGNSHPILWVHINATKVIPKKLLVKSSENGFILVPAFYLIMCLMKAPKNFEKIAILKIWELVSLGGGKTHFGKLALKWCIFRHEEIFFNQYYVIAFDPTKI